MVQFRPIISFILQLFLSTLIHLEFGFSAPSSSASIDVLLFYPSYIFSRFIHLYYVSARESFSSQDRTATDQNFSDGSQCREFFRGRRIDHNFFTITRVDIVRFADPLLSPTVSLICKYKIPPRVFPMHFEYFAPSSNSVGVCFYSNSFRLVGKRKLRSIPREMFRARVHQP